MAGGRVAIAALVLLASASLSAALSFRLESDETRCVQEDVNEDVLILGEYEVTEHDNVEVTLEVHGPAVGAG